MKNIVFVTGRLGGGGSERVLTLVANELLKIGYNVKIIAFGKYDKPYENKCPVCYLNYTNDFNQIMNLRKKIKAMNPDTVVAFEYYVGMKTILALSGLKYKVIVSERNDPHKIEHQKVKSYLRNILFKRADMVVCQTYDAAEYYKKVGVKKMTVICNPVKSGLPHWKSDSPDKIIVNFCKLEPQKNLPLLIKAFSKVYSKHSDYTLRIYGEGSEKNSLEQLIESMGLHKAVEIHPFSTQIHDIISNCYMFVSSSDFEGVSNSMMEAMGIGMPVVCTDCPIGGCHMIIQDHVNGILVPTNSITDLANAMNELIENPIIAKQIACEAMNINHIYSTANVINQWKDIIEESK